MKLRKGYPLCVKRVAVQLIKNGAKYSDVAHRFYCTEQTIRQWCKLAKTTRPEYNQLVVSGMDDVQIDEYLNEEQTHKQADCCFSGLIAFNGFDECNIQINEMPISRFVEFAQTFLK